MQKLLGKIASCWQTIRQWYHLLQPARACLLASALVPILFIFIDQGRDILRLVASEAATFKISWHIVWMFAGLLMAGLASWAWARFLLNCTFPSPEEAQEINPVDAELAKRVLRRVCGLLPPASLAVAYACLSFKSPNPWSCWILAVASLLIGVVLWNWFDIWHRREQQKMAQPGPQIRKFRSVTEIRSNPSLTVAIAVAWSVSALLFVALTIWPVGLGQFLGSAAVLLFAIASWISVGSLLIYWGNRYRVPVLTALLLWAVLCSCFNDNHDIVTLSKPETGAALISLNQALDEWHQQITNDFPIDAGHPKHPLYLVAAAGGGIRAAYWTATVLDELEDRANSNHTSFAAHTFAMSGVSGGSLGEVTFAGLRAHYLDSSATFRTNGNRLLDKDFLAADLAKMAFADLFQRFWPVPIKRFDRAQSLENAWAAAWHDELHTNILDESFGELYGAAKANHILLPHLLLNGTCVETGQRIITSDLLIEPRVWDNGQLVTGGQFPDALMGFEKMGKRPIALKTAAHQSARFTYFSPAGRFPDGTHVVDGGYFENSGAVTMMDALTAIRRHLAEKNWDDVQPMIVMIDNEPVPLKTEIKSFVLMRETLAPVISLLNTRTARGTYAFQQVHDALNEITDIFEFHLYERDPKKTIGDLKQPGELPLGWTLSQSAIAEMDAQLTHAFAHVDNPATITGIINTLPPAKLAK